MNFIYKRKSLILISIILIININIIILLIFNFYRIKQFHKDSFNATHLIYSWNNFYTNTDLLFLADKNHQINFNRWKASCKTFNKQLSAFVKNSELLQISNNLASLTVNTKSLWYFVKEEIDTTEKRLTLSIREGVFNRIGNYKIYDIAENQNLGHFTNVERINLRFAADSWLKLISASNQFNKQLKELTSIYNNEIKEKNNQQLYISILFVIIITIMTLLIFLVLSKKVYFEAKEKNKLHEYLINIINSMQSILFSIDKNNSITQWNKAASLYTNIKKSDAIGKKIENVFSEFKKYLPVCAEVIRYKNIKILPKEILCKSNNIYYNINFFPLFGNTNPGVVIRIDDITEIEKMQQQLLQSQKMESIGILAGGLAHDFNNILCNISASTTLMQHKIKSIINTPKKSVQNMLNPLLDIINQSTSRASNVVKQLLNLSKITELKFEPIDLNKSVQNVIKICENTFDKSIEIIMSYFPEKALINADITQIEQVLLNICINASHAMTFMRSKEKNYGGTLSIKIENFLLDLVQLQTHPYANIGEYWKISINDTGVGINKDILTKIFDPFFTGKKKGEGTGLGLAMAYNIIKHHKGFIDVYSEPDIGTTFNIFIPAYSPGKKQIEDKKPQKYKKIKKGTGVILIIDDEKNICIAAQAILKECGYKTITANNGEEALKIYKKKHKNINAIILDMQMPKMSGLEVFLAMKKIEKNVKVILTSGFGQDSRVKKAIQSGINIFIQKPYTMTDLSNAVYNILKN